MTTAAPSTALATIQPAFTDAEWLALAGFLAGYRGLTREAYTLDLRQFTTWCRARSMPLFAIRRARPPSAGRLRVPCCRAAPQRARRAAGGRRTLEHALISLLALNGLRVSEATGADIEHLGLERGHRTLTITRKGGKVVTIQRPENLVRTAGDRCTMAW
jgi:integrase/recombinase XerD